MFKIAKLDNIKNEKININLITLKNKIIDEDNELFFGPHKSLSFNISNDNYSVKFDLKCRLEKLLDLPINRTVNFIDYIDYESINININKISIDDPKINISINRYLENDFYIYLIFYTNLNNNNDYCGVIDFTFNLKDYLSKDNL